MIAFTYRTVCCLCLVAGLAGQEQTPPRSWRELQRSLSTRGTPADQRVALLEAFLGRCGDDAARRQPDALRARLALAAEHLARFDAVRAGAEFETTAELAPPEALDVLGRALYGLAQTLELTGDTEPATKVYTRIQNELAGTRHADFAKAALRRVKRSEEKHPRAGRPAPDFGSELDRDDKAVSLANLAGSPALLIFVDPADTESTRTQLRALLEAAEAGGLGTESMVTFVTTTGEVDEVVALAEDPRFQMPIVPVDVDGDHLSPAFLRYEVRSVPTTVLIGPDGTILGRDLPPRRLRAVLEALRR